MLAAGAFAAGAVLAIALGLVRASPGRSRRGPCRGRASAHPPSSTRRGRGRQRWPAGRRRRWPPSRRCCAASRAMPPRTRGSASWPAPGATTPAALRHFLQALRVDERPEIMLAAADAYRAGGPPRRRGRAVSDVIARAPGHRHRAPRACAISPPRTAGGPTPLPAQERLVAARRPATSGRASRAVLAGLHYERGRARIAAKATPTGAISAFRDALRVQPDFVPAAVALGDAHLASRATRPGGARCGSARRRRSPPCRSCPASSGSGGRKAGPRA